MPILASNFVANALQGTVVISGGQANIQLPLSAFAFEGQKTFQVKLRKEGYSGTVIGTSNVITVPDTATLVSFGVSNSTANASVTESNNIVFTVVTTNVPNGTNLYYSTNSFLTANVDYNDFVGGNTGVITINNNIGTANIRANNNTVLNGEDGEVFQLQLRINSPAGNIIALSGNVEIFDSPTGYINAIGGDKALGTGPATGYMVHTFTTSGTLTVRGLGTSTANNTIEMLVVGGGGTSVSAGGYAPYARGGGGGGYVGGSPYVITGEYPLTMSIGAGGVHFSAYPPQTGRTGNPSNIIINAPTPASVFSAPGGNAGGNGGYGGPSGNGFAGGNGGYNPGPGNTGGGGGGGAGAVGTPSPPPGQTYRNGNGGAGVISSINGTPTYYGGGGGGGSVSIPPHPAGGFGGAGGGGNAGQDGFPNTGGGAGAPRTGGSTSTWNGGSGIIIIRYPYA
jgi:hypothetical protein